MLIKRQKKYTMERVIILSMMVSTRENRVLMGGMSWPVSPTHGELNHLFLTEVPNGYLPSSNIPALVTKIFHIKMKS